MKPSLSKPGTGRRSFLWKAGTAVTAAAAACVPAVAKSGGGRNTEAERLAHRLGMLEDEKALRALHRSYETLLDGGRYEEVAGLFREDAAVVFHGGVFEGGESVARLYCGHFRAGWTGKKIGPAPDFETAQEIIAVAADRLSANARFPYSIQVGTPMAPDSQLVQMARLQGEGILKWCEVGCYEIGYARDTKSGNWKISRLEHRVVSGTDYRPGRTHAEPVSVPRFATTYPENPSGPDRLISPA